MKHFLGRARQVALLGSLLLGGCAVFMEPPPLAASPDTLHVSARVARVPFFPQQEYQCGPAALATLLKFSGVEVTPETLSSKVYTASLKGSLQMDLIGAARRAGRIPYLIAPTENALYEEIVSGHPVLVLQDVGRMETSWHYAVVTGYELDTRRVILQSGPLPSLQMSIRDFDQSWSAGGHWGLVTLLPDEIPPGAKETEFLSQVSTLDMIRPELAAQAYQTALERWPDSLGALMGLGNLAYANGDFDKAMAYFDRATQAHPLSGDAFNNLAEADLRVGRREEARAAIAQALKLGGHHSPQYQRTRSEIDVSQP